MLGIVKQQLVQIDQRDGPTEYQSYILAAIESWFGVWGVRVWGMGLRVEGLENEE